jgi:hypothetical protein
MRWFTVEADSLETNLKRTQLKLLLRTCRGLWETAEGVLSHLVGRDCASDRVMIDSWKVAVPTPKIDDLLAGGIDDDDFIVLGSRWG